ncbi:MAG: AsmA family [uncultured bacterium]|nr:MAG: AsmA family [uncultured bacterium]
MNRILKLTAILLSIVVLFVILGVMLLVIFVNPNRLKSILTEKVTHSTGRAFKIDGDISWTFFPYLGIKMGHMVLNNPTGFTETTFAEMSGATLGVRLIPLFRGQIESKGVTLKGLQVHLLKNAKGQVNWNVVPDAAPAKLSAADQVTPPSYTRKTVIGLAVSKVEVSDASVTYQDQQTKQAYAIRHFELQAKNISLMQPFPVKASFDFSSATSSGHAVLSSDVALNLATQIYSFRHFDLVAKLQQDNKENTVHVLGNALVDLDKQTLQGEVSIKELQAAKLTIHNIKVKLRFQNGILELAPFSADLYQGNLEGQAKIDLQNTNTPRIAIQAKVANIQAGPLLEDLGGNKQKIKITGTGDFALNVTTAGAEQQTLLRNLNGTSQFTFANGAIVGVDLGYLVDSAYQLIKKRAITAVNTNQTHFGNLTGTAAIRNGVVMNNDLLTDSPRFLTNGKGTIDLVQQKIDYALSVAVKQKSAEQKENAMNVYGITIPVLITGDLNDPNVRLDSAAFSKIIAEQQIQKVTDKATQKIRDEIKKHLPEVSDLLKGKNGAELNKKANELLNSFLR